MYAKIYFSQAYCIQLYIWVYQIYNCIYIIDNYECVNKKLQYTVLNLLVQYDSILDLGLWKPFYFEVNNIFNRWNKFTNPGVISHGSSIFFYKLDCAFSFSLNRLHRRTLSLLFDDILLFTSMENYSS